MSLPTAEQLTDYEYLRSILKSYHEALHEDKSFPPLSPDKAAHILAKVLGMKNSHVLKSEMAKMSELSGSAIPAKSPAPILHELEFIDGPVFSQDEPFSKVFATGGEATWYLYRHYVCEKLLSTIDIGFGFDEKVDDITNIMLRHELDVPMPILAYIENDESEQAAIDALKQTLKVDVAKSWPLDAIVELNGLYFSERDANEDVESWYIVRYLTQDLPSPYDLVQNDDCPDRLKV